MALPEIERGPAFERVSVYVIVDKTDARVVGKILFELPRDGAGRMRVAMWDWSNPQMSRDIQESKSRGFGCERKSKLIHGMKFGFAEREFTLNCDGTGMDRAVEQFDQHGYTLKWLV